MKIATWNVNSLSVRLPQVLQWLQDQPVDVLCLQELKLSDDKFPHQALAEAGYQSVCLGQKTYNGVAILSRLPLQDVTRNLSGFDDTQARLISATVLTAQGPLRVVNGYFVNGQAPGTDKFDYKMQWLQALRVQLQAELAQHERLLLLGDFNITADDRDSYDPEGLRETIHHTTEERQFFQSLLALGLHDAFRAFEQAPKSYSWWDYRELGFRRNRGLRIDHILVSSGLLPQLSACEVDKTPRRWERPSDHAPVIASFGA